ncbi:NAD(P)-dependent oxidoreductase, partial [Arthrospira platensis SPKY1]|nr:NAD(P)-dependent oxidoreductase [Arthrospira platensis SPKY1]
RANAFGMPVQAYDIYWDEAFAAKHNVKRVETLDAILCNSDILSLHTNLSPETRGMINTKSLSNMRDGVLIINCARGELVETEAMYEALKSGKVGGYGTDVLDEE